MSSGPVTLLVTGFEPFGGRTHNSSGDVVARLGARTGVVTAVLPVDVLLAPAALRTLIDEHAPSLVLSLGESSRATQLTVESLGRNDFQGSVLFAEGPPTIAAAPDLVARLLAVDVPGGSVRSEDAGAYVCNALLYVGLEAADPIAFVHVPALEAHDAAGLERLAEGVGRMVEDLLRSNA